MPRKLRVEYEGAVYHVMNRGDRREAIFHKDEDRPLLLETLGEVCAKTDWQGHALCLMSNHFHLVVEAPAGQPGGRNTVVSRDLHGAFESATPISRRRVQWALQVVGGG